MVSKDNCTEIESSSSSDKLNAVSAFYDKRGYVRLKQTIGAYGATGLPAHLRAPYSHAEDLIAKIRAETNRSDLKFLDLGCGTGIHSIFPASLGFSVVGLDVSPVSLAAASQLAEVNGLADRCRFVQGDAYSFLDENRDFDIILTSGVLYYFDLQVILPKLQAALRPGGTLICVETSGDNHLLNFIRRFRRDRDERTKTKLLRQRDLKTISAHFRKMDVRYFDSFTLMGAFLPLGRGRLEQIFHSAMLGVDRVLLNSIGLKSLAFKFVLSAVKGSVGNENMDCRDR